LKVPRWAIATDAPLPTAGEALSLARSAIDANKVGLATADLRQAATALGRYKSSARIDEAHTLASTIDSEAPLTRDEQGRRPNRRLVVVDPATLEGSERIQLDGRAGKSPFASNSAS
jgi:hypothetical protein